MPKRFTPSLVINKLQREWAGYKTRFYANPIILRRNQAQLRRKIRESLTHYQKLRLVIGAGGVDVPGWILTDLPMLDALDSEHWARIFDFDSIDRILMEHVIEHWYEDQFRHFLKIVSPYLAKNAFIRVAVPDGLHPNAEYITYVRPGGVGFGADDHKVLYDYEIMSHILAAQGYDCRLLEYFDKKGEFHALTWDTEDGMIRRSAKYDPRNKEKPLSYTSLIFDCWPK